MIFYYILRFLGLLKWLFVMPKTADIARVNPNAKCAGCGARKGEIRCVEVVLNGLNGDGPRQRRTFIQHRCKVCGARSFEDTVAKTDPRVIRPAIARTELEKHEDSTNMLASSPRQFRPPIPQKPPVH